MPIELSWYDPEKTIMYIKFSGEWNWEDYANSTAKIIELTHDIEYRLDQLIDMRESGLIPTGPALTHMHRSYQLAKYKQSGITVLVGASVILHGLISALAITNPRRPPRLFADTLEDAEKLIQDDRAARRANSS